MILSGGLRGVYDEADPPDLIPPVSPSPMRVTVYDMPRAEETVARRDNLVARLVIRSIIIEAGKEFYDLIVRTSSQMMLSQAASNTYLLNNEGRIRKYIVTRYGLQDRTRGYSAMGRNALYYRNSRRVHSNRDFSFKKRVRKTPPTPLNY